MADRLERLTNLVAVLLETGRALTLEEIVERVPGYPDDKEAYRRQFERDKATLREIGVPISLEAIYPFEQEMGYRVLRRDYELPPLSLTEDEQVALYLAVSAVRLQSQADGGAKSDDSDNDARYALQKIGGPFLSPASGGGVVAPLAALPAVPFLPALFDAVRRRARLAFRYRGEPRRLDPYGILFRNGHWYTVGHDPDRDAIRAFRADRFESAPEAGPGDAFDRPEGFDPSAALRDEPWRFGDEQPVEALVLVDAAQAGWVASELGERAVAERRPDGSVVVKLAVTNREAFRSFVLGLLDQAEVLAPDELRADIVGWLEALARSGGGRP